MVLKTRSIKSGICDKGSGLQEKRLKRTVSGFELLKGIIGSPLLIGYGLALRGMPGRPVQQYQGLACANIFFAPTLRIPPK